MTTAILLIGTILILLIIAVIFILLNQKRSMRREMGEYLNQFASDALQSTTKNTIAIASQELASDRQKLKEHLDVIHKELSDHRNQILSAEKQRTESYGAIWNALTHHKEQTDQLKTTTENLSKLLSNNQMRGGWGEQQAELILSNNGLIEGTHYKKQYNLINGNKPDFVFMLPDGKMLALDAKFPFSNLQRFQEAKSDEQREEAAKLFRQDLKNQINQVATRGYTSIDNHCLDFAIMFVPAEMIYSYIQQKHHDLYDYALKQKIILTSPSSLLITINLILRQYQYFYQNQNIQKIFKVIDEFSKDYLRFEDEMLKLESTFSKLGESFQQINKTRSDKLHLRFRQIKNLQSGEDKEEKELLLESKEDDSNISQLNLPS